MTQGYMLRKLFRGIARIPVSSSRILSLLRMVLPKMFSESLTRLETLAGGNLRAAEYFRSLSHDQVAKAEYLFRFYDIAFVSQHKRKRQFSKTGIYFPGLVVIGVTGRCNLHCQGCLRTPSEAQLSLSQIGFVIDTFSQRHVKAFAIIGGEPLLVDNLLTLLREREGEFFLLFTNGTLLSEGSCRMLAEMTHALTIISEDGGPGLTEQRKPGFGKSVQKSIAALDKLGVNFAMSAMVSRHNWQELMAERYLESVFSSNCKMLLLFHHVSIGRESDSLVLRPDEIEFFNRKIGQVRGRFPLTMIFPHDILALKNSCTAGREYLYADPAGDVYGCPFLRTRLGNIFEQDVEIVVRNANRFNQTIKEDKVPHCRCLKHNRT